MKLTAENVDKVFKECNVDKGIKVSVLKRDLFFDEIKLSEQQENIKDMANQLPSSFLTSGGGGMSFLNACIDKDNCQWGEQINVARLLGLGLAIKYIDYCFPEEMWNILPGGMPYFTVKDKN